MNFDKESKSRIQGNFSFFFGGGGGGGGVGGGGGGRVMNTKPLYFIHKTHCHDLFYITI